MDVGWTAAHLESLDHTLGHLRECVLALGSPTGFDVHHFPEHVGEVGRECLEEWAQGVISIAPEAAALPEPIMDDAETSAPVPASPVTISRSGRGLLLLLREYLARVEFSVLLVIGAVMGSLWAFLGITEAVLEGDTHQLDQAILLAMRSPVDLSDPLGPPWLEELGRDVTALGGVTVLVGVTLATICYLVMAGRRRMSLLVLAAVGGGLLLSGLLKLGFDRPRPDLVPHGSMVYSASFPSGHAMMSAATYLTLGALLAHIHARRRLKAFFIVLAVVVTLAVGISRVYLGVHWPTDVVAGWSVGTVWALLCWLAARWLRLWRRAGDAP